MQAYRSIYLGYNRFGQPPERGAEPFHGHRANLLGLRLGIHTDTG